MRTFDAETTAAINSNIQTIANGKAPKLNVLKLLSSPYWKGESGGETIHTGATSGYASVSGGAVAYLNGNDLHCIVNGIDTILATYNPLGMNYFSISNYNGNLHYAYLDAYLDKGTTKLRLIVDGVQVTTDVTAGCRMIENASGLFVFLIQNHKLVVYRKNGASWASSILSFSSITNINDVFVADTGSGFVVYATNASASDCTKVNVSYSLSVVSITQNYAARHENFALATIPAVVVDGEELVPETTVEYATGAGKTYIKTDVVDWTEIATGLQVAFDGSFYVTSGTQISRFSYDAAADISHLIVSAKIDETNDNPVQQLNLTINGGNETFNAINPGDKFIVSLSFGSNTSILMGVFYSDSVNYTALTSTVSVSCRNSIGKLKDSTYGRNMTIQMTGAALVQMLCFAAGITSSVTVQGHTIPLSFSLTSSSFYDNIIKVVGADVNRLVEMPDGSLAFGSPLWLSHNYRSNGEFDFTESELFARQKTKSVDAVNKFFGATKGSFTTLTEINNFPWSLPAKYTIASVPESVTTQTEFDAFCSDQLDRMQYIGKTESYTAPIRPQLQTGDVAKLNGETLGIVTKVTHVFDAGGFTTQFSVDSGGKIMTDSGTISTKTMSANGYTRKQTLSDMVGVIARRGK